VTGARRLPVLRWLDPRRPADRSALAAVAVAALLALVIWSPAVGARTPGDPAAMAGDARLARCGGELADAEFAFVIPHARDYRRYLPAMERATELEIEPAALVVIYRGPFPGTTAAAGASPPAGSPTRNICIYVGDAGAGEINYYSRVSIVGARATLDGPVLVVPAAA